MPPEQQTPPEAPQAAPTVDNLIAQANAEAYTFHNGTVRQRRSPKEWFLGLQKTQKILFITGALFVLFAGIVIGLTSTGAKSGSLASQTSTVGTTDTNGDGVVDQNDTTAVSGDTNGDGVVDSRDDASANTTDSESASWWSGLFDKARSVVSSSSSSDTSSDDSETYADAGSESSTTSAAAEQEEEQEDTAVSEAAASSTSTGSQSSTTNQTSTSQTATSKVTLSGVENFRDAAASSSGLMKSGVLYRSAKLEAATTNDRKTLASLLKNGVIIDLRTVKTRSSSPDAKIENVTNLNYPVVGTEKSAGYIQYFVDNATDRKNFGAAITKIANTKGGVLIHCTAGKDRTGWTVAMIMYAIGANDKQVMNEYLKSKDYGMTVDSSWLNAALKAAKKNNGGSIINYIKSTSKGLGVSNATIAKLKTKLSIN